MSSSFLIKEEMLATTLAAFYFDISSLEFLSPYKIIGIIKLNAGPSM